MNPEKRKKKPRSDKNSTGDELSRDEALSKMWESTFAQDKYRDETKDIPLWEEGDISTPEAPTSERSELIIDDEVDQKKAPLWGPGYVDTPVFLPPPPRGSKLIIEGKEYSAEDLDEEGDIWIRSTELEKELGIDRSTLKKNVDIFKIPHPTWIKEEMVRGLKGLFFHEDLANILREQFKDKLNWAPEEWVTVLKLATDLRLPFPIVNERVKLFRVTHPLWFKQFRSSGGEDTALYCHPDLAEQIRQSFEDQLIPSDWVHARTIAREVVGTKFETIVEKLRVIQKMKPGWVREAGTGARVSYFAHPKLVEILRIHLEERTRPAPPEWADYQKFEKSNKGYAFKKALVNLRFSHPHLLKEFFPTHRAPGNRTPKEYVHPDLIDILNSQLVDQDKVVPSGWKSRSQIATGINLYPRIQELDDLIFEYRKTNPNFFKYYKSPKRDDQESYEYFHPELVKIIYEKLERKRKNKEENKPIDKLIEAAKKLADGTSPDAEQLRKLIAFFGESSVVDIIFQLHPEYKPIGIEKAQSILGEYLGDFLTVKGTFNPDDLRMATEFLGNVNHQKALTAALKRHCLEFYYKGLKAGKKYTDAQVVDEYFKQMSEVATDIGHKGLSDIILEVSVYFESLFKEVHKPGNLIDSIGEGREFPDINQRVNARELREKNRLYIADEMGLGKSASAIFSKEYLECKTAVVLVPKNLIPTWRRYLSDDPAQGGYFKPGQAPKVLVVESSKQIQAGISGYDYVLIAQEKLNDKDVESLKAQGSDMLVIDEMHKLKKPQGKRSDKVLDLATAFRGEDKYLAMLSGTPIPNTVRDLAVTLKMLFPEETANLDPKVIATSLVIPGEVDVGKLRARLLDHMQMKRLEDSVEMPPKKEIMIPVELGEMQGHLYEAALEQDEVEGALAKMNLLSQVLLNPRILDTTPGIENAKQRVLEMALRDSFKRHNKIIVFVNGQVKGVLRGEFTILEAMDLGEDVKIHTIHGKTKEDHRIRIQKDFQTTDQKEVVFIFGRVSDVGVDFSNGQVVYFYDEPWTQYDKNQQIARVWRPGVKGPVEIGTLTVPGTIDEGLHFHIAAKYKAVEKVLRGIPLSEMEKEVLLSDDDQKEAPEADVNPELAKYYYNAWKRMLKMFSHHKEQGEEKFKEFLEKYGKEYARSYIDLSARSYQANANRFAGALIGKMIAETGAREQVVVDMASGPDMLKRHMRVPEGVKVINVDLNPAHFEQLDETHLEASFTDMPMTADSVDYCNLALALHYTRYVPSKGDLERVRVLREMNRVLKVGGRAVISELYSLEMRDQAKFEKLLDVLGFELVREYSGKASSSQTFSDFVLTIEKKRAVTETAEELQKKISEQDLVDGLKFKQVEAPEKLKDVRMVMVECEFNGRTMKIDLNEADSVMRSEEQTVLRVGKDLIRRYDGIGKIPREEVIRNGFSRWSPGFEDEEASGAQAKKKKKSQQRKYLLFRKLQSGPGIVMFKG